MKKTPQSFLTFLALLRKNVRHAGIMLVVVCSALTASAANEKFSNHANRPDFASGDQVSVSDSWYSYLVSGSTLPYTVKALSNKVILSVNYEDKNQSDAAFNASVNVVVTVYNWNGSAITTTNYNRTLSVTKTASGVYQDKYVVEVPNPGHRMDVNISTKSAQDAATYANYNLQVEGVIEVERYFNFSPTSIPTGLASQIVSTSGDLRVEWPLIDGAESYELEWTHVYSNSSTTYPSFHPHDMRINSTRISTADLSYDIPLLYDEGFIIYRVRGIGRVSANNHASDIPGRWSSDAYVGSCNSSSTVACVPAANRYYFGGHEKKLNWQSSVAFIEDGKRKEGIGYYDGSLRSRQSLSKIESDKNVIIGESIYDYAGRAAVQVMPVPVISEKIEHRSNFSQSSSLDGYHASDFDAAPGSGNCVPSPTAMSNQSGAARYYSPVGFGDFGIAEIPDAEGYPFTQTIFTPDQTGRAKSASGPGESHRIGSGHETRSFYGKPFQEELDMLFGSEAGYSEFYQKNMTVDANGQVSVAYTDLAGKTIATGIEGSVPTNLTALDDQVSFSLLVDLLNKKDPLDLTGSANNLSSDGKTLSMNTSFVLSSTQQVDFGYEMTGTSYSSSCSLTELPDGTPVNINDDFCYECVYDLTLSLKDECGEEYLWRKENAADALHVTSTVGQSVLTMLGGGTYPDATCPNANPPAFDTDTDLYFPSGGLASNDGTAKVDLPVGSYTVNKRLTLNEDALNYYTEHYLENNDCLLSYQDFEDQAMDEMDFTGCGQTCDECRTAVNGLLSEGYTQQEVDELLLKCDEMCDNYSTSCTAALNSLLNDVSPNGQYGRMTPGMGTNGGSAVSGGLLSNGNLNPAQYPLSVFSLVNFLPRKNLYVTEAVHPNWRNPLIRIDNGGSVSYVKEYRDQWGNQSYVALEEVSAGVYEPNINGSPVMISGSPYAKPEQLTDLNDFVAAWQPSWAKSLVIYHPEYLYYVECIKRETSNDFDHVIMTSSYTDIVAEGYHAVPSGSNNPFILSEDPYYDLEPLEFQAMKYFMQNFSLKDPAAGPSYYSIFDVAKIIANNPTQGSFSNCLTPPSANTAAMTEPEWEIFRGLYISLKQKFLAYRDRMRAINSGYYNGCIGNEDFDPFRHNFFGNQNNINNNPIITYYGINGWLSSPTSQFLNIEQPCNYATQQLYKHKTARFASAAQYLGMEEQEEGGCNAVSALGEFGSIHQVCEDYLNNYSDHLANQTAASFLKECGLCPVAKDLELILNTFADPANDKLLSSTGSHQVSCLPAGSPYLSFTPALDEAMFDDVNDLNNFTFWEGTSLSTGTEVTGTFTKGSSSCDVSLQMVGANMGSYDVDDIVGFCCMKYAESSTSYSYLPGRNFTIKAIVNDVNGGSEEILMEGKTTCLDLLGCEPNIRVCEPTETAKQLQRLLNGLLYSTSPVSQKLIDESVDLSQGLYRVLVNNGLYHQMHQLLGSNATDLAEEELIWNSTLNGTKLEASVSNYNGNQCELEIEFGSVNAHNVTRIFQIEPDPSQGPNYFTAQVEIDNGSSITYDQVTGYSPCLNFGTCEPSPIETIEDTEPVDVYDCTLSSYAQSVEIESLIPDGPLGGSYFEAGSQAGCFYHIEVPGYTGRSKGEVVSVSAIKADQAYVQADGSTKYGYFYLEFDDGSKLRVNIWSECDVLAYCEGCFAGSAIANGSFEASYFSLSGYTMDGSFTENTNLFGSAPSSWSASTFGVISDPALPIDFPQFDHTHPSTDIGTYLGFAIAGNSNNDIWNHTASVAPQTDYVFSAWFSRITLESEEPYVELVIDGITVETMILDNPVGEWQELRFEWNSGTNTSIPLELAVQTTSGSVIQKLALDDVDFSPECPKICQPRELLFNGDFELGLSGFTTDLNYLSPNPFYTFLTYVDGNTADHTYPSTTNYGNLFSTAEIQPQGDVSNLNNTLLLEQSVSVQPNTDYLLEFWWIMRQSIDGSEFSALINGVTQIIISEPSPIISPCDCYRWAPARVIWNSGNSTSLNLQFRGTTISEASPIYLDDVSIQKYCTPSDLICDLQPTPSITEPEPCVTSLLNIAKQNAQGAYEDYIADIEADFQKNLIEKCMTVYENMSMNYDVSTARQYTLYYYDHSGNLVRTVPPAGVNLTTAPAALAQVKADRANGTKVWHDKHSKATTYHYNSLNQLIEQTSPDVDNFTGERYANRMWYDELGRMVVSQTSRQRPLNRYSYSRYDNLGRIVESGEVETAPGASNDVNSIINGQDQVIYSSFIAWIAANSKYEVSKTYYDAPASAIPFAQENLRTRIASVYHELEDDGLLATYDHATHYSYDIHGNVKRTVQDFPELTHLPEQRYKVIEYDYDLISGNVLLVSYQPGATDQLYHRYDYDGDNRIQKVWVSSDGVLWDEDARYQYYPHTPLRRTELGQLKVQGLDNAYTLQGWLKGVNSNTLEADKDMGEDGNYIPTNINRDVARDQHGFSLGYFNDGTYQDYKTAGPSEFLADLTGSALLTNTTGRSLYNGNINHMITSIRHFMQNGEAPFAMRYEYDQLNRLKQARVEADFDHANNQWGANATTALDYQVSLDYDKDGNITFLTRNGTTAGGNPLEMDNLSYDYTAGRNRLNYVDDAVADVNYTNDLDDQDPGNYSYDAEGNLITDAKEEIQQITWTAAGKVKEVIRTGASVKPDLEFKYDANGNRIAKVVKQKDPGTGNLRDQSEWRYTYYVRDANGQVMATYQRTWEHQGTNLYHEYLQASEQHLYGSSRLGLRNANASIAMVEFQAAINGTTLELNPTSSYTDILPTSLNNDIKHQRGKKSFELSNHLGNVLTVVSDRRLFSEGGIILDEDFTTLSSAWSASVATFGTVASIENGKLKLTTNGIFQGAIIDLDVDPNSVYTIRFDGEIGTTGQAYVDIRDMTNNVGLMGYPFGNDGTYELSFTTIANTQTIRVRIQQNDPTDLSSTRYFYMDNLLISKSELVYAEELSGLPVGTNWTFNQTPVIINNDLIKMQTSAAGEGGEITLNGLSPDKVYTVRTYIHPHTAPYTRFKVQNNGVWIMDEPVNYIYGGRRSYSFQIAPGTSSATIRIQRDHTGINNQEIHLRDFIVVEGDPIQPNEEGAEVLAANDYYPFGMLMPGRSYSGSGYRFGFNGMERDDEMKGNGNSYDFGARIYASRIGRFSSLDPLASQYPHLADYAFVGNMPTIAIDPDGKKIVITAGDGTRYEYTPDMDVPDDPFVKATVLALNELNHSESFSPKLQLVHEHETTVNIIKDNTTLLHGGVQYNENFDFYVLQDEVDLSFNPKFGLIGAEGTDQEGKVLYPFQALGHEIGHRYDAITPNDDGETFFKETFETEYAEDSPDYMWTNPEEKKNITKNEHPLAKEREDGLVRNSHKVQQEYPDANFVPKSDFESPVPVEEAEPTEEE